MLQDKTKGIFPISVIAEELQVHQRTLRIYDDEGILKPSRSLKNRRLYSIEDIEKGKFIQYMTRELGINLAGIKIIFGLLYNLKEEAPELKKETDIFILKTLAADLNITSEKQAENRIKLSKRGRKQKINTPDTLTP